jgi:hypothetical protein
MAIELPNNQVIGEQYKGKLCPQPNQETLL